MLPVIRLIVFEKLGTTNEKECERMPTFKVDMRLHKTVTLLVEAESEDEIYGILDKDDNLDPEMYWKATTTEDWNQVSPFDVKQVNEKADYIIGDTKFGRDFIVKP